MTINRNLAYQARRGGCPHPPVVRQSRTQYNRVLPNVVVRCDCAFGDGSMCSIDPYAPHQRCVIARLRSSRGNLSVSGFVSAILWRKSCFSGALQGNRYLRKLQGTDCHDQFENWSRNDTSRSAVQNISALNSDLADGLFHALPLLRNASETTIFAN